MSCVGSLLFGKLAVWRVSLVRSELETVLFRSNVTSLITYVKLAKCWVLTFDVT